MAVVAGVAVFVVLVGVVPVLVLRGHGDKTSVTKSPPSTIASVEPAIIATTAPWTSRLHDMNCLPPCGGGSRCVSAGAKPCASGFTCIPGDGSEEVDAEDQWNLFVSAVWERTAGSVGSACNSATRTAEICFRPASTGAWTCVPLSDPCSHGDRATIPIPIRSRDLMSDGVDVTIRDGGKVLAERRQANYGGNMRRRGLCIGFKLGSLTSYTATRFEQVTFFLEPR